MEFQNFCCQVYWRLIPLAAAPLVQSVVYWAMNRASRCTNAVEDGLTRLTAPPMASSAMPPTPPLPPCTLRIASTPPSSVPIPALLSGVVKRSDFAYWGTRDSVPPAEYAGRWQAE